MPKDGGASAWVSLTPGEEVWIRLVEGVVMSGWVDAIMPDGSGVWIHQHDARGRSLVLRSDASIIVAADDCPAGDAATAPRLDRSLSGNPVGLTRFHRVPDLLEFRQFS